MLKNDRHVKKKKRERRKVGLVWHLYLIFITTFNYL